jgi:putative hemolysin
MNLRTLASSSRDAFPFSSKIKLEMNIGRFRIKTLENSEELKLAFLLRYQVFQVEMVGLPNTETEDFDEYDSISEHLGVFDTKTDQMIATCRLNCSLFSDRFYSLQEFQCRSLLERPETKLEIGRVCVHRDFRKGVIILLLWRAIAHYMMKTGAQILFGCGSVPTQDPREALILYKYLEKSKKVHPQLRISPAEKYTSLEFEKLLLSSSSLNLSPADCMIAQNLLPPLCRSYFDIGCFIPGPPAFDREFKCIDFLTILESRDLDPKIRQKMLGS